MPTYCFTCPDCGKNDEAFGSSECPPHTLDCECGGVAERNFAHEQGGKQVGCDWYRGHESRAMGCIPSQAKELRAALAPHGVKVTDQGNVVCDSPGAKKRALKAMSLVRGQNYVEL